MGGFEVFGVGWNGDFLVGDIWVSLGYKYVVVVEQLRAGSSPGLGLDLQSTPGALWL